MKHRKEQLSTGTKLTVDLLTRINMWAVKPGLKADSPFVRWQAERRMQVLHRRLDRMWGRIPPAPPKPEPSKDPYDGVTAKIDAGERKIQGPPRGRRY